MLDAALGTLLCLWGLEAGNVSSGAQTSVPWKRPGAGHWESACMGLSRVIAAQ